MAKKSAISKGYRKSVKKKPFLTKKEIIELIVILAVIVAGVVLFNIFYDDGFVKAKDVQPGDIVSYASTDLRDRYSKVAEIGELEGFTLEERDEDAALISAYVFKPDGEQDHIDSISVNGSFVGARALAESTVSYMSIYPDDVALIDIQETTIDGYDAVMFAYGYGEYDETLDASASEESIEEPAEESAEEPAEESAEETADEAADAEDVAAEEETPADNKFTQVVSAYVAIDDTHTLCFHIYRSDENADFYLTEDQLVDFVANYTGAFVLEQK